MLPRGAGYFGAAVGVSMRTWYIPHAGIIYYDGTPSLDLYSMSAELDLYRDDLAVYGDPEIFAAVEAFTRVSEPAMERTQEGYLLDFKAAWSDSALKTVAAFANTFGGLLLVGVSEQQGRADQLAGVAAQRQELKTSIASSIASNISPTPPYEVRDLAFPDGSGRHLCIVRVRKGNRLHLLTKKGEPPVYVRNEDESRPANAAELQALLATRFVHGHSPVEAHGQSLSPGAHHVYVTQAKTQNDPAGEERTRSETYLQVRLTPVEPLTVRLDLAVERQFFELVRSCFPPEIAENVYQHGRQIGATFDEYRTQDWYHITYTEMLRDHEMRWGCDSAGTLHFVTQTRYKLLDQESTPGVWSLCDMMTNLDCAIELAHQFWDHINYVGEAGVLAELRVESLPLLVRGGGLQSGYASAFYERPGPRRRVKALSTEALTGMQRPGIRTTAVIDLTYATRSGSHAEPVSIVVNRFLRDLGYAADLTELRALF